MTVYLGIDPEPIQHPDDPNVWVTGDGRVFKRINKNHPERRQWLEYKLEIDKDGYKKCRIAGKNWRINRLVYSLFVGDLDPDKVVCHLDGNLANNSYSNLLQASQKVNISHKAHHGTQPKGESHPKSKHGDDIIHLVKSSLTSARRTHDGKLGRGEAARISKETGVGLHTVYNISSGKTYQ